MQKTISVRDAMTRMPVSIGSNLTISECAKLMVKENVGSLIIQEAGILKGIITEKDIVKKIVAVNKDSKKNLVKDVMTKSLITIGPTRDIIYAMKLMTEHDVRRLPVLEENKLIGLLTLKDILRIQPALIELVLEKSRFLRGR